MIVNSAEKKHIRLVYGFHGIVKSIAVSTASLAYDLSIKCYEKWGSQFQKIQKEGVIGLTCLSVVL